MRVTSWSKRQKAIICPHRADGKDLWLKNDPRVNTQFKQHKQHIFWSVVQWCSLCLQFLRSSCFFLFFWHIFQIHVSCLDMFWRKLQPSSEVSLAIRCDVSLSADVIDKDVTPDSKWDFCGRRRFTPKHVKVRETYVKNTCLRRRKKATVTVGLGQKIDFYINRDVFPGYF